MTCVAYTPVMTYNNVFITGLKFWKTPSRKIFAADRTHVRGKAGRTSETTAWNTTCLPLESPSDLGPQPNHEVQEILAQLAKLKIEIEKIQLAMWVKSNTSYPKFLQGGTFTCIQVQNMPGDSFCATSDSGQMLYQHHWLSKMCGHMVFRDKCPH